MGALAGEYNNEEPEAKMEIAIHAAAANNEGGD
jgi:hypothetical protein